MPVSRKRKAIAVTLPEDLITGIRALADRENRPVSREVERALVFHLVAQDGAAS